MSSQLSRVMVRRWYCSLAGLAVTAGLVAAALVVAPVSYVAQSNVLLVPPANPGDNPLLSLSTLTDVPNAVVRSVLNDRAVNQLAAEGVTDGYAIGLDPLNPGPLLIVTASGRTNAEAVRALRLVTALISPALENLQSTLAVPAKAYIHTQQIRFTNTAEPVTKTRTRTLLVAVVLGFVLTALFAIAGERIAIWRRRRRERVASVGEPAGAIEATVAAEPVGVPEAADRPVAAPRPAGTPVRVPIIDLRKRASGAGKPPRANGTTVNGTPVNGTPVNGAPINRAPTNGAPVNGAEHGAEDAASVVRTLEQPPPGPRRSTGRPISTRPGGVSTRRARGAVRRPRGPGAEHPDPTGDS